MVVFFIYNTESSAFVQLHDTYLFELRSVVGAREMTTAAPLSRRFRDLTDAVIEKLEQLKISSASEEDRSIHDVVNELVLLEKETRRAEDQCSNLKVCAALIELCAERKAWSMLCDLLTSLCRRRGLPRQSFEHVIARTSAFVLDSNENGPPVDSPDRLRLIETLRECSAGKMQVELFRARLTRELALHYERAGDVDKAATILQDLNIDTGTGAPVSTSERLDFTIEQMRLCLAKRDYLRAQLISRRINPKHLKEDESGELELRFSRLMVLIELNEKNYLGACEHILRMFNVHCKKLGTGSINEVFPGSSPPTSPLPSEYSDWLSCLREALAYLLLRY
ncbi:hypothetical protein ACOME3_003808 [Neoechinorhynchus agilis]